MSELNLEYTAINIAKAEKSEGISFFEVFQKLGERVPSVSDLVFLLRAGGATDEQVNEHVGKGIVHCFEIILRGIKEAGFLGDQVDMDAVIDELRSSTKLQNSNTSGSTGKV